MKIHLSLLIALTLPLAAFPAGAQDHGQHAGHQAKPAPAAATTASKSDQEFAQLDQNQDGFLTKSEFPAKHALKAHFSMMDKNRDGKLEKKEFAAGQSMR